jgi:pilus assembly protein Flp/PilA
VAIDRITALRSWITHLCRDEQGVTAIEYGLLAALIAVACIAGFVATGGSMSAMYVQWTNAVMAAL